MTVAALGVQDARLAPVRTNVAVDDLAGLRATDAILSDGRSRIAGLGFILLSISALGNIDVDGGVEIDDRRRSTAASTATTLTTPRA